MLNIFLVNKNIVFAKTPPDGTTRKAEQKLKKQKDALQTF
jgi:hypothetical protein